jgi:hypothetical protein
MSATRDRAEAELVAQPSSGDIEILDGIDDVIDADDSSSTIPDAAAGDGHRKRVDVDRRGCVRDSPSG